MTTTYIHYGSNNFDLQKFNPISNQETLWNKPSGGFWASPIDAKLGWRNWCQQERYELNNLNAHFNFLITPNARVHHLYTSKDLEHLPKQSGHYISYGNFFYPDFEKMMEDGWDAIELHLSSSDRNWDYEDGLYWRLYGWDCDSILIMNPNIILPIA